MAELLQREQQYTPLWQQSGRNLNFHRWAGFNGALSIIFTAYTEHGNHFNSVKEHLTLANQMHYIHTLALLAIPLARRPKLSGILFLIGILLYCIGSYICAIFGMNAFNLVTTSGAVVLIIAWISLMF